MGRAAIFAGIVSLAIVTGCDAVQLPGVSDRQTETEPAPETSEPVEATASQTEDTVSEEIADTSAAEASETVEFPAETPAPLTEPSGAPSSLAAINAAICGEKQAVGETLTAAARAGVTSIEPPSFGTATVNGLSATLANFPGIVKLEPRKFLDSGAISSGHCSATRIARNWFVTAAHCVDDTYDELRLVTGSETLSSPLAVPVVASHSVCHSAYEGPRTGYANDVALLFVSDAEIENVTNVPISALADTDRTLTPSAYPTAEMAGWGLTGFDEGLSNELLSAQLSLASAGPAAIRVTSLNGAGPCIGDSGGPLFVTEQSGAKKVVGVLSVIEQSRTSGAFCDGDYGGRYTNLLGYKGWINDVIAACEASPSLCASN